MDPIANLREQREVALLLVSTGSKDPDAARLAELVLALDEWRMKGGFDPYSPTRPINVNLPPEA